MNGIDVVWLIHSMRNGSFNISFSYAAIQVFMYEGRIQRASDEKNLLGNDSNSLRKATITGVLPYAKYTGLSLHLTNFLAKLMQVNPQLCPSCHMQLVSKINKVYTVI